MGFWSKVGKVAGKAALGIVAPGALAGYEYQKAKETNEILKVFDESIEMVFKSLARTQESDGWSELLVLVRSAVVDFLKDETNRKKVIEKSHPGEEGRICCGLAALMCTVAETEQFAKSKGANLELLQILLNLAETLCQELDKKILSANLTPMEEDLVRSLFDITCTSNLDYAMIVYVNNQKDVQRAFLEVVKLIFSEEGMAKTVKDQCVARNLAYHEIKRKMGC